MKIPSNPAQPENHVNIPIVAIGASAGGQDAVVELLKNLSPAPLMAYVYIRHPDPNQESHLTRILGCATSMIVREAKHLMRADPNQMYIKEGQLFIWN